MIRWATTTIGRRRFSGAYARKKPSVMIFASEVPVIAKLNKYREIEDVFYAVWQRTDPDQLERLELEDGLTIQSAEEKME